MSVPHEISIEIGSRRTLSPGGAPVSPLVGSDGCRPRFSISERWRSLPSEINIFRFAAKYVLDNLHAAVLNAGKVRSRTHLSSLFAEVKCTGVSF